MDDLEILRTVPQKISAAGAVYHKGKYAVLHRRRLTIIEKDENTIKSVRAVTETSDNEWMIFEAEVRANLVKYYSELLESLPMPIKDEVMSHIYIDDVMRLLFKYNIG